MLYISYDQSAADDYREVSQGQEVNTYYIPGGCRALGPGRMNYFFKFAGPSYSIDTACSSGLAAIEADTAVAGSVNVLANPDNFAGLCNGHFLTEGHNACKTWDTAADGDCQTNKIRSVVIKRLEDAEADNDNILGVILGAGTNHSAEGVSITHPHAGHQAYLARQVLRQAGVDPLDVSYVELHGTGTQAGDFEEMQGIMDVYAPLTKRRTKDQPPHIGAIKANVGHGESVAGTTALIKVLLMLQKNAIPPHVGIKTEINPTFPKDFDKRNLHIPFEITTWLWVGRVDFLDRLIKSGIGFEELKQNAILLITAGSETTATLLAGAVYLPTSHPEVLKKLTAQVRTMFKDESEIALTSVNRFNYMLAVLNECLRCYPPLPLGAPRIVPRGGTNIAGYTIPGSLVGSVTQWVVYHDPTIFADPNRFELERFTQPGVGKYANDRLDALNPFLVGPRNCIG
ncbi:hypothetical protein B7463_g2371, partial [Scytalidium lignicola]